MTQVGLLSKLKTWVAPSGSRPRRVPFGLFSGLTLEIDLACQTQLYLGLWERETYAFLRRAMARSGWLIDVGAGSGELVLAFLLSCPEGRAWAIEPSEEGRAALARNLALNPRIDASRVIAMARPAGPEDRSDMLRLDTLPVPASAPGLVKIDVDGAELDVLRGSEGLLSREGVSVLVETHSPELERECMAYLQQRDYHCRIVPNAWWRAFVPEQRPSPHNRWLAARRAA